MARISSQTAIKVIYWNAVAATLVVGLAATSVTRRLHAYDELIVQVGRAYNVDPRLIAAVIWKESRFEAGVVGPKGELGLMQVMEATGREWADAEGYRLFEKRDLFDPEVNVKAGTWYLAKALKTWASYPDPYPYALATYNAGLTNAQRWADELNPDANDFVRRISFPATQDYVRDVLTRYRGGV